MKMTPTLARPLRNTMIDKQRYLHDLNEALKPYLDKMRETWGTVLEIIATAEYKLRVKIEGFPYFFATSQPKRFKTIARFILRKAKITEDSNFRTALPNKKGIFNVSCQTVLNVKVNFNIQNFQHKGIGFYITNDSVSSFRTPKKVAKIIANEVTAHRNTCKDCGIGVAPIQCRLKNYGIYLSDPNTPPDPVEEMVNPVLSKKLKEKLQKILLA